MEFRVALSDVERGIDATESIIVGLEREETHEHLMLRVLAFCLLHEPGLEFARGPALADAADLWAHDLIGRVAVWVECGETSADKLRHVTRHNRGAQVHVVGDDPAAREALKADLSRRPPAAPVELWTIDGELVRTLATNDLRRQRWAVTLVGGHVYVDAGVVRDGPYDRIRVGASTL
jgi:uncharacterized protein YaeQ